MDLPWELHRQVLGLGFAVPGAVHTNTELRFTKGIEGCASLRFPLGIWRSSGLGLNPAGDGDEHRQENHRAKKPKTTNQTSPENAGTSSVPHISSAWESSTMARQGFGIRADSQHFPGLCHHPVTVPGCQAPSATCIFNVL